MLPTEGKSFQRKRPRPIVQTSNVRNVDRVVDQAVPLQMQSVPSSPIFSSSGLTDMSPPLNEAAGTCVDSAYSGSWKLCDSMSTCDVCVSGIVDTSDNVAMMLMYFRCHRIFTGFQLSPLPSMYSESVMTSPPSSFHSRSDLFLSPLSSSVPAMMSLHGTCLLQLL